LDQFRSTQPRRTKLPESLWQAAVERLAAVAVLGALLVIDRSPPGLPRLR
jgi:hypothetical protein